MAQVKFYTGTYETYKAATKNPDALYFLTDTLQLYKGTQLYTANFKVVSNPPTGEDAVPGILYVSRNTHQLYIADESGNIEALTPPITDAIKQGSKDLITSGGVYDAIQSIITTADELENTVGSFNDRVAELEKVLGVDPDNPTPDDPVDPDNPDAPVTPQPSIVDRVTETEKDVEDLQQKVEEDKAKIDDLEQNAIKKDPETGIVEGPIKVSGTPTADEDVATKKYVDDKVKDVTDALGGLDQPTIDGIKDVVDWINDPEGGSGALVKDVADLKENTVRKEEGKGLSTNDFTNDYKQKLDDLVASGAENVIESVKVNGSALAVADDKSVNLVITTGTGNGNITVNGQQVKVSGLKSAAYQETSAFATAEQGKKADTALQKSSIAPGNTYGTLLIGDKEVAIPGLGTAAYKDADTFIDSKKLGDLGAYQTIAEYANGVAEQAKEAAIKSAQDMMDSVLSWEQIV